MFKMFRRTVRYINSIIPENDNPYDEQGNMITNFWIDKKTAFWAVSYGLFCYWTGICVGMGFYEKK